MKNFGVRSAKPRRRSVSRYRRGAQKSLLIRRKQVLGRGEGQYLPCIRVSSLSPSPPTVLGGLQGHEESSQDKKESLLPPRHSSTALPKLGGLDQSSSWTFRPCLSYFRGGSFLNGKKWWWALKRPSWLWFRVTSFQWQWCKRAHLLKKHVVTRNRH